MGVIVTLMTILTWALIAEYFPIIHIFHSYVHLICPPKALFFLKHNTIQLKTHVVLAENNWGVF